MPYFLVGANGCPYWTSQEVDAGAAPVWPGPVLYSGSPHGQYGGAGAATDRTAAVTARAGLDLANERGACAVVYPGLDTDQAQRLAAAGRRQGAAHVLDLATDVAHLRDLDPGSGLDHWWANTPTGHRRDIRRQWRRGTEAGLALHPLTGKRMLPHLEEFTRLAVGTAERHGATLYGRDMFERLAEVPGAVLLAARTDRHLVGGLYCWLHEDRLYLWASGIDYQHPFSRLAYTWLMTEAPRWAMEQGARHIDAGRANYQAKKRLGYQPHVLRTVVHLPAPDPATAKALAALSRSLGEQALHHHPTLPW
ncbi:GNAT family N-acetyltransferase [Kitasatospora sp. A2-31]|uniref:GNAT family N-acetyltransferase n=2 Tax=Kitasatospora sp. A2-31 TaxID=2916414 RepID=UPI001EEB5C23|nr:GNAT family N-acetyltransferase [Kitasatospora sp. A2-31]MCG6496935.1 GNAT family N-acetyltransferase [Kitasatospora sp. A2-31]